MTAEIERRLENAPVPIRAMSEKQWQLMFMEMLGNVQALLGGIGLATAFTLFLITSNTLAMSARERRGEAALLASLVSRQTVLRLLVLEGAFFGVAGAVLAVGFMTLFARSSRRRSSRRQSAGIGALLSADATIVAVVASLAPRRRPLLARSGHQPLRPADREPRAGGRLEPWAPVSGTRSEPALTGSPRS